MPIAFEKERDGDAGNAVEVRTLDGAQQLNRLRFGRGMPASHYDICRLKVENRLMADFADRDVEKTLVIPASNEDGNELSSEFDTLMIAFLVDRNGALA